MVKIKEVPKKEIGGEWAKAVVCVWKTSAKDIPDQVVMDKAVDGFVAKINAGRPNRTHAVLADYRKIYYCPSDNTFRIASWFLNTHVSTVSQQYELSDTWAVIGDGYEPISFGYGKNFSEQATCLKNCMVIADTLNGKLHRRNLGAEFLKLYANMPFDSEGDGDGAEKEYNSWGGGS